MATYGSIIDGKEVAKVVRKSLKPRIAALAEKGIVPGLATVLVGDDPASATYVRSKIRACEKLGLYSETVKRDADLTQQELIEIVESLNANDKIHGILVQSPVPAQIDELAVTLSIAPEKDVDGFHPHNVGMMLIGKGGLLPCTPHGIIRLLSYYKIMKPEYFQWAGRLQFRLIDIPAAYESSKQAASAKAAEVLEKIRAGEDFAELAKKHSAGHRAQTGGLWTDVTTGSLAQPYDILETQAEKMQPGEVSGLIETDGHIFIMKLESKRQAGYEPFEDVQEKVEEHVRLLRQRERFEEMVSDIFVQADIEGMDRFVDFCVETAYRRCGAKL